MQKIFLDFEIGIYNSIQQVFNHKYEIIGCYFDAIKNKWQNASKLKQKRKCLINQSKVLINSVKCFLHFPISIRSSIWEQDKEIKSYKKDKNFSKFIQYLKRNYVYQYSRFGTLANYLILKFEEGILVKDTIQVNFHLKIAYCRLNQRITKHNFLLSYVINKVMNETDYFSNIYQLQMMENNRLLMKVIFFKILTIKILSVLHAKKLKTIFKKMLPLLTNESLLAMLNLLNILIYKILKMDIAKKVKQKKAKIVNSLTQNPPPYQIQVQNYFDTEGSEEENMGDYSQSSQSQLANTKSKQKKNLKYPSTFKLITRKLELLISQKKKAQVNKIKC